MEPKSFTCTTGGMQPEPGFAGSRPLLYCRKLLSPCLKLLLRGGANWLQLPFLPPPPAAVSRGDLRYLHRSSGFPQTSAPILPVVGQLVPFWCPPDAESELSRKPNEDEDAPKPNPNRSPERSHGWIGAPCSSHESGHESGHEPGIGFGGFFADVFDGRDRIKKRSPGQAHGP